MAQYHFDVVTGNQKEWEELPAGTYRNIGYLCEMQDSADEPTEKSGIPVEHNATFTATTKAWILKDAYHSYRLEDA